MFGLFIIRHRGIPKIVMAPVLTIRIHDKRSYLRHLIAKAYPEINALF